MGERERLGHVSVEGVAGSGRVRTRPGTGMAGHSVLTVHLNNAGPTKEAEARTIAFFRQRLGLDHTSGLFVQIRSFRPAVGPR
jgi:hypothetical protein